jgi:hypothetical protein
MNVKAILSLIPEKELSFLTADTNVDHQVKKLDGVILFRLILFSMLHTEKVSLRVMEKFYSSAKFRVLVEGSHKEVKYNSIRDRIATINAAFFERLFNIIFTQFNSKLNEQDAIIKYDSTLVTMSAKLVDWTLSNGTNKDIRKLKITIGQKGSLPCSVKVYNTKEAASEDIAIPLAISEYKSALESIVVFDRGVQSRKEFDNFSSENQRFIGRLNLPVRYKMHNANVVTSKPAGSSVTINKDEWVYLINRKANWSEYRLRKILGTIDETGEEICFITNVDDLTAYEIAAYYKQRWEIEVFFKFLKQHLNLNHLVVRTENGIKVMLYMTLITAILIIAYKSRNQIKSYKIAKLKFELELEELIIKDIVIICGGDPTKAKHLWNSS